MTRPIDTQIGHWRQLHRLSRPEAAALSNSSLPRWIRFESERIDYLRGVRGLFGAVGSLVLILPPTAGSFDTQDVATLGHGKLETLVGLIAAVVTAEHPNLGSGVQRDALARSLVAAALQAVAPNAATALEQGAALARALRTDRYSLGFEPA